MFHSQNTSNSQLSFELDPAKCPDAKQRELNLANFQAALDDLIASICSQSDAFPPELKHLFYLVRQRVHAKTPNEKLVRVYCVSAFVFLRLLCPAMLNTKSFGLKLLSRKVTSTSDTEPSSSLFFSYGELAEQFSLFTPKTSQQQLSHATSCFSILAASNPLNPPVSVHAEVF